MSADELCRAVDLLLGQVGHWTTARWAAPSADGDTPRRDLVHRLVQQIADLDADAEGQPRRGVPRLDNDLALPDQLRVVTADLIAAGPPDEVLAAAADRVRTTRIAL
ncbi:MAG TPA: hypothetical protein VHN18_06145 [Micromonosporaceae bacterium]|nr:hypothetical protein [Micromonosporaceae bacterium]